MESHDEERIMVKVLTGGNAEGSYNTRSLPTALDRMELDALFLLLLPGPKMIWQFGELGYDYSINTCENPSVVSSTCRLVPKPVLWGYFDQANRKDVYKMYGRLNYLKTNYEEFSTASVNSGNLSGMTKWFTFSNGSNHAAMLGNFATSSQSVSITFPKAGTWYDYFGRISFNVNPGSQNFTLGPGEFRLFTTRQMTDPFTGTGSSVIKSNHSYFRVYPNPAKSTVTVRTDGTIGTLIIKNLSGQLVLSKDFAGLNKAEINLENLRSGVYLVQAGNCVEKLIKY